MFGASILLAFAIAATEVLGTPIQVRTSYAVKEVHRAPTQWVKEKRAPAGTMLRLQIGLKQGNFAALANHLNEGIYSINWQRESETMADFSF